MKLYIVCNKSFTQGQVIDRLRSDKERGLDVYHEEADARSILEEFGEKQELQLLEVEITTKVL